MITLTKRADKFMRMIEPEGRIEGHCTSHDPSSRIDRNYLPGARDFMSAGGPHVVSGGSEQSNYPIQNSFASAGLPCHD